MGGFAGHVLLRQRFEIDVRRLLAEIVPQSASLHTLLWNAHFYLAFLFFALILMHLAAALFHALVRRDGVFESMAPVSSRAELTPAE